MDNEPKKSKLITSNKALFLMRNFASLIGQNLLHIGDKNYVPEVDPGFEVVARTLDKMPLIPVITMGVQTLTGRNLPGGKLSPVRFFLKKPMPGQGAMGLNRASYTSVLGIGRHLGKDIGTIVRNVITQFSLNPLYEGFSPQHIRLISLGVVLYGLSRYITIVQTGNDRSNLHQKYKNVVSSIKIGDTVKKLLNIK